MTPDRRYPDVELFPTKTVSGITCATREPDSLMKLESYRSTLRFINYAFPF